MPDATRQTRSRTWKRLQPQIPLFNPEFAVKRLIFYATASIRETAVNVHELAAWMNP